MEDVAVLQHAADLHALNTLKLPGRQALYLKALGYRYHEIAQLTGSTYTAVNRRLTEGRRRLRELRHNSDEPTERRRFTGEKPPTACRGGGRRARRFGSGYRRMRNRARFARELSPSRSTTLITRA